MLNNRYDNLKNGRVKPIPRDDVVSNFREKSDRILPNRVQPHGVALRLPLWHS
jgi:hypothetical protein